MFFSIRPVILLCVVKTKERKKETESEKRRNFCDDQFCLHTIIVTFEIMGCPVYKRIMAK